MYKCKTCKRLKPLINFKPKKTKLGHDIHCKTCKRHLRRDTLHGAPLSLRNAGLLASYDICYEDYMEMYEAQGGRCAICGDFPKNAHGLYVDHDHSTGKVRELLCHACNSALGFLRESDHIITNFSEYLKKHKS